MGEVITALHEVLNLLKDFGAGYSTETFLDGKMVIEHKGVRYFLKIEKIGCPSEKMTKDIEKLRYWD